MELLENVSGDMLRAVSDNGVPDQLVCSGNSLSDQLATISLQLTNIETILSVICFLLFVFWIYERIKYSIRQFNKTR